MTSFQNGVLGLVTFGIQVLVIGQLFTFGKMLPVFEIALIDGNTITTPSSIHLNIISAIGTLQLGLFFISFAFASKVLHFTKYHITYYLFFGSILWGFGILLSPVVPTILGVFMLQSVCAGLGGSFMYWSTLTYLIDESMTNIIPFVVTGGGIGMIVFTAISVFFTNNQIVINGVKEWQVAYFTIGGVGLVYGLFATYVFWAVERFNPKPEDEFTETKKRAIYQSAKKFGQNVTELRKRLSKGKSKVVDETEQDEYKQSKRKGIIRYIVEDTILTKPMMGFMYMSILLSNMAIYVPFVHIVQYINETHIQVESSIPGVLRDMTSEEIRLVSSDTFYLLAGGSITGRLITPVFISGSKRVFKHDQCLATLVIYALNLLFVAITLFLWLECKSRETIFSFAFFFGFGSGSALGIMPLLIHTFVELDKRKGAPDTKDILSIFNIFMGIGACVSAVITASIHDAMGGYYDAIIATACFQLLAAVAGFGAIAAKKQLMDIIPSSDGLMTHNDVNLWKKFRTICKSGDFAFISTKKCETGYHYAEMINVFKEYNPNQPIPQFEEFLDVLMLEFILTNKFKTSTNPTSVIDELTRLCEGGFRKYQIEKGLNADSLPDLHVFMQHIQDCIKNNYSLDFDVKVNDITNNSTLRNLPKNCIRVLHCFMFELYKLKDVNEVMKVLDSSKSFGDLWRTYKDDINMA